ncbi:hypothetical protein C7999DRAFT_18592, partial [Corynascus novoguineensis]
YDVYDIARYLRIDYPERHVDEFLLHGTISVDSYRILAMFYGNLELENVALSIPGWRFDASIPRGFAHSTQTATRGTRTLRDATRDFQDEIYSLTGSRGSVKLESLLRSIGRISSIPFYYSVVFMLLYPPRIASFLIG